MPCPRATALEMPKSPARRADVYPRSLNDPYGGQVMVNHGPQQQRRAAAASRDPA